MPRLALTFYEILVDLQNIMRAARPWKIVAGDIPYREFERAEMGGAERASESESWA